MKFLLFRPFGRLNLKKTAFSLAKYRVLAFPETSKPCVLRCSKHFFHAKSQPNARKSRFSPPKMMLWLEFWGLPRGPKRLKKHVFELFLAVFSILGQFSAAFLARFPPPPGKPKMAAGSPKRSPLSPKRLQKELPKKPKQG